MITYQVIQSRIIEAYIHEQERQSSQISLNIMPDFVTKPIKKGGMEKKKLQRVGV